MEGVVQVSRVDTDRPQKVFIGIAVLPKLEALNTEKVKLHAEVTNAQFINCSIGRKKKPLQY